MLLPLEINRVGQCLYILRVLLADIEDVLGEFSLEFVCHAITQASIVLAVNASEQSDRWYHMTDRVENELIVFFLNTLLGAPMTTLDATL